MAQNARGRRSGLAKLFYGLNAGPSSASQQNSDGDIGSMLAHYDSWPSLVENMARPDMAHRLVLGRDDTGELLITEPRRNVLILGPPRSQKTAGVLTPAILGHPGPVVTASTRDDLLRATGLVRARMGRVWHYSPDGSPVPPGCLELRWSPITASRSWGSAVMLGEAMADVAEVGGRGENASFFREKAGVLIPPLLHAAALGNKSMRWLLKAVNERQKEVNEAKEILVGAGRDGDGELALDSLEGILDLDPRTRGSIFTTAALAFKAYILPGAIATTEEPNFDPAGFVAGQPAAANPYREELLAPGQEQDRDRAMARREHAVGIYDTIYVTASTSHQKRVAPLVVGLLQQIREATFAQHGADQRADEFGRPSVLWAIDELAGIAPIRDLPETLSQSGGQGLLVAACIQDLSLARQRWGEAAEGFLTLFGNVVVLPDVRDKATLEAISTAIGKHWVPVRSTTMTSPSGPGSAPGQWSETSTRQQVQILDTGAIRRCRSEENPDYILYLTPKDAGYKWTFCAPYYLARPWPQLLVGTMEFAAARAEPLERAWTLASPILDMYKDGRFLMEAGGHDGPRLLARYRNAASALRDLADRHAEFKTQRLEPESLLVGYNDTRTARWRVPRRLFIALNRDPGSAAMAAALERHSEIRPGTDADRAVIPTTPYDAINTPLEDVPEAHVPQWVLSYGDHKAHLDVVDGGVGAKLASGNSIIGAWQDEIGATAVLIEAWCWSHAAGHMVQRLGWELQEALATCVWVLSDDWHVHCGRSVPNDATTTAGAT